nr:rod shape-determining protein MreC [Phenylobacterium immobile]
MRGSPLGELKVPLTWTAAVAVVVAAIAGVVLLVSDRYDPDVSGAYGQAREMADTAIKPVGQTLTAPVRWVGGGFARIGDYLFAGSQNRKLKAELVEARQWRDVALALRDTNERYRSLLGLRTDPPIPMVAARVVTDSRGPFANTRIANAGAEAGVKSGNPVMSETGLVGRVIGVAPGASRILLLTDVASRTPVMIDRTNARAILTGDGGGAPRLDYMRGQNPVKNGDRVVTSGDGGVFPRGLPVGVAVRGLDGRWRVELAADRTPIDYVKILLFVDFTQLADQAALARANLPPPTLGGAAPTVTAQLPPQPAQPRPTPRPRPQPLPPPSSAPPHVRPAPPPATAPPAPTLDVEEPIF